ncbi:MAG: hypothetical protein HC911_00210 [Chloroflexaceae bacterium]|nr:hypothetical protein [Chloroflexaceae bacterium]
MSGADGEELKSGSTVKTAFTEVRTELDVQDSSYVAVVKIVEAELVGPTAEVDLPAVAVAAEPVSVRIAADLDAVLADLDADVDVQSPDFLTGLRARLAELKGKLALPSLPTGDADGSLGTAGIAATGAGAGLAAGLTLPTLSSGELDLTALPPEVETQLATRYERSRLNADLDAFDARFADTLHGLDPDHEFRTEYAALRSALTTPDADLDANALIGWRARLAELKGKLALPSLPTGDAGIAAADLDAVLADLDADVETQSPDFLTGLRARLAELKGKLALPSLPTGDADGSLGTAGIAATGAGLAAGLTLPTLSSGELDLTALPPEVETQLATRYERYRLNADLDAFDARFADTLHELDPDHEFRTEYAALRATLTTPDTDLDADALIGWRARLAALREQLAIKLALPSLPTGDAGIAAAVPSSAVPEAAADLDAVLTDLDTDVDVQSPDFLTGLRARLAELKGKLHLPSLPTGDADGSLGTAGIAATGAGVGLAAGLTLPTLPSGELDLTALPPEVETQLATRYERSRLNADLDAFDARFADALHGLDPDHEFRTEYAALRATLTTPDADLDADALIGWRARLAALREQLAIKLALPSLPTGDAGIAAAAPSIAVPEAAADLDAVLADLDADVETQSPDFLTGLRARLAELKGKLALPSLPTGDADGSLGTAGIAATGAGVGLAAGLTLPTLPSGELDLTALPPEVETQLATYYDSLRLEIELAELEERFSTPLATDPALYATFTTLKTNVGGNPDPLALPDLRARLAALREQMIRFTLATPAAAPLTNMQIEAERLRLELHNIESTYGLLLPEKMPLMAEYAELQQALAYDVERPEEITILWRRLVTLRDQLAILSVNTNRPSDTAPSPAAVAPFTAARRTIDPDTQADLVMLRDEMILAATDPFQQRVMQQMFSLSRDNHDWLWHVTLTMTTAAYGYGFNRAAIFLNENTDGTYLRGILGIGNFDYADALGAWGDKPALDFDTYITYLREDKLEHTPVELATRAMIIALGKTDDAFTYVMEHGARTIVPVEDVDARLPLNFIEHFGHTRYVLLPVRTRSHQLGVLVADNYQTNHPIADDALDGLQRLLNRAALIYLYGTLESTDMA